MKKNKETYLIILDTNMVYYDSEDFSKLFNSNAKEILNFLKVNKISQFFELCIPQVVLEERITQRIKQVEGKIKKIKEGKDTLKEFIEISLTNEKDIKIILETKAKEFVNKNKILVFTESTETAYYLHNNLPEDLKKRALVFTGESNESEKEKVIRNCLESLEKQKQEHRAKIEDYAGKNYALLDYRKQNKTNFIFCPINIYQSVVTI